MNDQTEILILLPICFVVSLIIFLMCFTLTKDIGDNTEKYHKLEKFYFFGFNALLVILNTLIWNIINEVIIKYMVSFPRYSLLLVNTICWITLMAIAWIKMSKIYKKGGEK